MTKEEISAIVSKACEAFQSRDFEKFVGLFASDAIFETPFAGKGGARYVGLSEIQAHFKNIGSNPWVTAVDLKKVSAEVYTATKSPLTVIVEYFSEGILIETGEAFKLQTSVAIIEMKNNMIVHYKDFPNSIGIARLTNTLEEFAARLVNNK